MNRKRILVVDDEVGFTRMLKLTLEQTSHYEVRIENRPEQALNAAREFRPHLVLLDVIMPRMFGVDVATRLRGDDALGRTPIVFFTATLSKTRLKKQDGVISGFPFLAKPSSIEEVIEQIERRLAAAGSETPTAGGRRGPAAPIEDPPARAPVNRWFEAPHPPALNHPQRL